MHCIIFISFLIQLVFCKIFVDENCNVTTSGTKPVKLLKLLHSNEPICIGSFGKVHAFPVAEQPHCKIIVKAIDNVIDNINGFVHEYMMLKSLNGYPYSPDYYGSFIYQRKKFNIGFIFMEHIEGEDLLELLNKVFLHFDNFCRMNMSYQIWFI